MNKKIYVLLYVIFLIGLSGLVSADINDSLIYYYPMEDNAGSTVVTDALGRNNLTASYNTNAQFQSTACMNNNCTINPNNGYVGSDTVDLSSWTTGTVNLWLNATSIGTSGRVVAYSTTFELIKWSVPDGGLYCGGVAITGAHGLPDPSPFNKWTMITLVSNGTYVRVYYNATEVWGGASACWLDDSGSSTLRFGNYVAGGDYETQGKFDEIAMWNRDLTSAEITSLYNAGAGDFYPFAGAPPSSPSSSIEVDLYFPQNNTAYSSSDTTNYYYLRYSYTNITNCSLYTNITGAWIINQTNTTAIVNGSLSHFDAINITPEGDYLWNIGCWNSTDEVFDADNFTFTVDTTYPTIDFVYPTEATNTYWSRDYVYANVSVTDSNLNFTKTTLWNISGYVNTTLLNEINFTNLAEGIYYLNATACDYAGQCNSTETRTYILDTTYPVVNITYPVNDTYTNNNSLSFYFTNVETNQNNCSLYSDFSGSWGINSSNYTTINTLCYQETANISTSCGGLDTGNYYSSKIWDYGGTNGILDGDIDGDWDTKAGNTTNATRYINYTVPNGATSSSVWQVSWPHWGSIQVINNLSLGTCWNDNIIQLRYNSTVGCDGDSSKRGTTFECYDGINWNLFGAGECGSYIKNYLIYEEAMWWDITTNSFNITNIDDGNHLWNIECCDTAGNCNFSQNNFTLTVDTSSPTYITNFLNNSIHYQDNHTVDFNMTDNILLHSYNISIDGVNIQGNDSINAVSKNVTFGYNMSNLSTGDHILTFRMADGHTALAVDVDSYNPTNGLFNDYIAYNFDGKYKENQIKIQQKDSSLLDSWSTVAKKNKYSFTFKPNKLASTYTFNVESDTALEILEHEKYGQWLVTEDEHWVDFSPYKPTIKLINDNLAEVTINVVDAKQSEFVFNSIGDLNIVTVNYTFGVINASISYSSAVSEELSQTQYLYINKTGGVLYTNASFLYNGTYYNTTYTNYTNYDQYSSTFITPAIIGAASETRAFNWSFNVTGVVSNISASINATQFVYKLAIDNCSTYTLLAANFSSYEDIDGFPQKYSTLRGYFRIWQSVIGDYKEYNITWNNDLSHSLCISNESFTSGGVFNVYAQMVYSNATYADETYYLYNATLTNITSHIPLYFTNGSLVTFTVTDQNDNEVNEVYIHVLRYDLTTNSYVTTEILKTGTSGTDIGHITLDTVWYQFFLYYQGVLVLDITPAKISLLSKTFRLNFEGDNIADYNEYKNMLTNLTYNNNTRNFVFTFTNPSGISRDGCLEVTKKGALGDTVINDTCTSGTSGTVTVNIDGYDNISATYLARGYIVDDEVDRSLEFLSFSFDEGYKEWGKDGIFATFFLRLAVAMIAIYSPTIAIVLLFVVDILMYMLGLFSMDYQTIIVYFILVVVSIWRMNKK